MPTDRTDKPHKYSVGQRVKVCGWVSSDHGIIREIKKTYHLRLDECVWGYKIEYENEAPLSLVFVPEGYLRLPEFVQFQELAFSIAPWSKEDRVEDHDPKWHEFGILYHTNKVIDSACRINGLTKIDIVRLAVWHDIGKFIVRQEKGDNPGSFTFKGHEVASAEFLKDKGFNDDDLFLIANHGIIRGESTVEEITKLCGGDRNLMTKLIFMCAADTSGKGFTPDQAAQRNKLAPKFVQLAWEAGLDEGMVDLIREIILEW